MNKLALSLWTGMGGRNLIHAGIVKKLDLQFNLKIFSSFSRVLSKESMMSRDQISSNRRRLISKLYYIQYYALWFLHKPATQEKYIRRDREQNFLRYCILLISGRFYAKFRGDKDFDWIRDNIYFFSAPGLSRIDSLFLSSTDCPEDQLLMYVAKKQNIRTIALVHSWDNLPSRGMLSTRPDRLLVWNESMKEQAKEFHSIPDNKITVVGVPQYEWYRSMSKNCEEDVFRKRNDIPLGKKVIVYTAASKRVFPDEEHFVEELRKYVTSKNDLAFILRLHPEERKKNYLDKYQDDPGVLISNPDNGFRANPTDDFGSKQSVLDFISLMKFSNVVINLASTITLDAILFDTPVICPSFNNKLSHNSWNAAAEWYKSSHFKEIAHSGAVPIVTSFEELTREIEKALSTPNLLAKERKELHNRMMPEMPTSQLICDAIEEVVGM